MIPLKDESPVAPTPVVTYALVAANVVAFVWQLAVGIDVAAFRGGAIAFEILTFTDVDLPDLVPPPLTLLTSMFLHAGFLHLASNLLFLWTFGDDVEVAVGRRGFALLYAAAGLAAGLVQTVAAAATGDLMVPMVGASGAIAGVLAAYLRLFPRARVIGVAVIGVWLALQILAVVFGGHPGVAHFAHLGGFVAGWLLARVLGRPAPRAHHASG